MAVHPKTSDQAHNVNVVDAEFVQINYGRTDSEEQRQHLEEALRREVEKNNFVFVETRSYKKAKSTLDIYNVAIIVGSCGEGKSFIAKRLVFNEIEKGFKYKKIKNVSDLELVYSVDNYIILLDNAFYKTSCCNRVSVDWTDLICTIQEIITDSKMTERSVKVIITVRPDIFGKLQKRYHDQRLFNPYHIIDLNQKGLTLDEKSRIFKKHNDNYEQEIFDESTVNNICNYDTPSFPNCVHMFFTNPKIKTMGLRFFENPIPLLNSEISALLYNDKALYSLLVLLILNNGEIHEDFLERTLSKINEDILNTILDNIKPANNVVKLLRTVIDRKDPMYLLNQEGVIKFRYRCISQAVCRSFGVLMPEESLKHLPFSVISERVIVDGCSTSEDDEVIVIPRRLNRFLAERFLVELEEGNIKQVCRHRAFSSHSYVTCFLSLLQNLQLNQSSRLKFILQITEREHCNGALLNGSILYWSASVGTENLCHGLVSKRFYNSLGDKFFVRTQASAALVVSCWYGFSKSVLQGLIDLGADMISALNVYRGFQTYNCDYCTTKDQYGMSVLQSAIFGDHIISLDTVEFILSSGVQFKDFNLKHIPLIFSIRQRNASLAKLLLSYNTDVNIVNINQQSAIFCAVEQDDLELAEVLLRESKMSISTKQGLLSSVKSSKMAAFLVDNKIDSDLDYRDENDKNLLHHAQTSDACRYFIELGCQVNHADEFGRTPLFYAKDDKIMSVFIENNARVNILDKQHRNVLHYAKTVQVINTFTKNLTPEDKKRMLNQGDEKGHTPIFMVQNLTLLKSLLELGSSVNHKAYEYRTGDSVSEYSLTFRDKTDGQLIYLEESSDNENWKQYEVFKQTFSISSSVASVGERTEHSEMSLGNSNMDKCWFGFDHCKNSYNILMWFILENRLDEDTLNTLMTHKIDIMATDSDDQTVLHYLLSPTERITNIVNIFKKVLEYANDCGILLEMFVNTHDINGNTALHLVCSCRSINKLTKQETLAIIKILMENGANSSSRNNCGETPLHFLLKCKCCFAHAVRCIVDRSNINEVCMRGWQPINFLMSIQNYKFSFNSEANIILKILFEAGADIKCFINAKEFFPMNCNPILLDYLLNNFEISECIVRNMTEQCCRSMDDILGWANSAVIHGRLPIDYGYDTEHSIGFEFSSKHQVFKRCLQEIHNEILLHQVLSFLFIPGCCECDINSQDEDGNTILMLTVKGNLGKYLNLENCVEYLLKNGADANIGNHTKETVVQMCILSKGSTESVIRIFRLLEQYGTNISYAAIYIWAAKASKFRAPVLQFVDPSINPNIEDTMGNPFHYLVESYTLHGITESLTSIAEFVKRGVDINYQNSGGNTPLHLALQWNTPKQVITELLRNGAQTNIPNKEGYTPFHYVFLHRAISQFEIFDEFIKYGTNKCLEESEALHLVVSKMRQDTLRILLRFLKSPFCAINSKDSAGNSLLHNACTISNEDDLWCSSIRPHVVRLLLGKGLNVNVLDSTGSTVLHKLVRQYQKISDENPTRASVKHLHGIISIMNTVIANGIDASIKDDEGKSASDYVNEQACLIDLVEFMEAQISPENLLDETERRFATCSQFMTASLYSIL